MYIITTLHNFASFDIISFSFNILFAPTLFSERYIFLNISLQKRVTFPTFRKVSYFHIFPCFRRSTSIHSFRCICSSLRYMRKFLQCVSDPCCFHTYRISHSYHLYITPYLCHCCPSHIFQSYVLANNVSKRSN